MEYINCLRRTVGCGIVVCALTFLHALPVHADLKCSEQTVAAPARQIVTCEEKFMFEREAGASVVIRERALGTDSSEIEVRDGAILIVVTPGSSPTRIRTPHAIAAVRGTTYVVDAGADNTSVFVIEGEVSVSKIGDQAEVALRAGEGVDVSAQAPLAVAIWATSRVSALLSRFGR